MVEKCLLDHKTRLLEVVWIGMIPALSWTEATRKVTLNRQDAKPKGVNQMEMIIATASLLSMMLVSLGFQHISYRKIRVTT